jgi:hypothetical protein
MYKSYGVSFVKPLNYKPAAFFMEFFKNYRVLFK